ncbi:MAG: ATP-binding protein, partial [Hominimerdicola sp.]
IWTVAEGRNLHEIISNSELMIASNLMNIIVMFLGYKLYIAVIDSNRIKAIKVNEAVFLLLMTLLESYVIYNYMWKADSSRDGIVIITMLLGFLFFDIYIAYIIQQISEAYKYKYELSMANRQNEIQLAHYRDMEIKYQKSRIVIHDIKKHLSILGELKNTDDTKAVKYGNLIEEEINSLFFGFHCSNQILSIVTSQKIASAEKEKIEVITKIQDLNLDFINDFDITAIFANLWDNAIEACVKLSEERRFIKLYMKKINGFIIINMENSFDNDIIKSKDKILSTKDNHIGVGLSIIDDTVKKYDGLFITEPKDGVFNAEITIPIPIN